MAALRVRLGPEELIFEAVLERAEEYRDHQHHELAEAVAKRLLGS